MGKVLQSKGNEIDITPEFGIATLTGQGIQQPDRDKGSANNIVNESNTQCVLIDRMSHKTIKIDHWPFRIGREADCDLVIDDNKVSRRHAEIHRITGGVVISDLQSRNGTFVNGVRTPKVIICNQDVISIGKSQYVVGFIRPCKNSTDKGIDTAGEIHEKDNNSEGKSGESTLNTDTRKRRLSYVAVLILLGIAASVLLYRYYDTGQRVFVVQNTGVGEEPANHGGSSEQASKAKTGTVSGKSQNTQSQDNAGVIPNHIIVEDTASEIRSNDENTKEDHDLSTSQKKAASRPIEYSDSTSSDRKKTIKTTNTLASKYKTHNTGKVDAILGDAMQQYREGNFSKSMSSLESVSKEFLLSGQQRMRLGKEINAQQSLHKLYLRGHEHYQQGNKEKAFTTWLEYLKQESAYAGSTDSKYAREIKGITVREYEAMGNHAYQNDEWKKAYQYWQKASEINPESTATRSLHGLQVQIQELYTMSYKMESADLVRAMELWEKIVNIAPSGTEYHTKAQSKLQWYRYLKQ